MKAAEDCRGRPSSAHQTGAWTADGRALWICTACAKIGAWGEGWGMWSAWCCRESNHEPCVSWVACSSSCAQHLKKTWKHVRPEPEPEEVEPRLPDPWVYEATANLYELALARWGEEGRS